MIYLNKKSYNNFNYIHNYAIENSLSMQYSSCPLLLNLSYYYFKILIKIIKMIMGIIINRLLIQSFISSSFLVSRILE